MGKKKNKTSFTINKIEVDTNTAEPVMVELNELEYAEEIKKQEQTVDNFNSKDAFDDKHVKQAVITKVFGVNNEENISKRQQKIKKAFSLVFIVLVVLILAFTFYNDFFGGSGYKEHASFSQILEVLKENWFYIIFALISLFFVLFFKGSKLSILCKTLTNKFHFKTCTQTAILGAYYNSVTPLAVGGQPFEIYHLSKNGIHGGTASSLPIVAFFENQLAFVILSIVSVALLPLNTFKGFTDTLSTVVISLAIVGLILCMFVPSMVIIFSMTPKFCAKIVKFVVDLGARFRLVKDPKKASFSIMKSVMHNAKSIKKITTAPIGFALSIVVSFGEQLANASICYFTLRFFGFDLPSTGGFLEWLGIVQLCFILYSAISFIPTPGNSGAADISFYTLFYAGVVRGLAFPALMVWRGLSFYAVIIIGFMFIKIKKRKDKKLAQKNQPRLLI